MGLNISVNASHQKLATFVSDEEQNMMGKRQAEVIVDGILGRGIKPAPVIFHNNLS
jgi:NAD(P)H-hydrate repair Nnr-like enzyme with NAD(P)H-hydrate epimerase domain